MRFTLSGVLVAAVIIAGWNFLTVDALSPITGGACEVRTFDYVKYLQRIDQERQILLRALTDSTIAEPADERDAFLERKLEFLNAAEKLVETLVRKSGDTYACVDDGYRILWHDLHVVSFQELDNAREIRQLEHRIGVGWSFGRVVEIVFAPLVLIILTVIGWFLDKKFSVKKLKRKSRGG